MNRSLGDQEWKGLRARLLEYIHTLARWDRDRKSKVEREERRLAS
jgi:hypothetical protein